MWAAAPACSLKQLLLTISANLPISALLRCSRRQEFNISVRWATFLAKSLNVKHSGFSYFSMAGSWKLALSPGVHDITPLACYSYVFSSRSGFIPPGLKLSFPPCFYSTEKARDPLTSSSTSHARSSSPASLHTCRRGGCQPSEFLKWAKSEQTLRCIPITDAHYNNRYTGNRSKYQRDYWSLCIVHNGQICRLLLCGVLNRQLGVHLDMQFPGDVATKAINMDTLSLVACQFKGPDTCSLNDP